ncbi:MAG: glycoside hydrolase family 9 protein [Polyangiaceae bacterium]
MSKYRHTTTFYLAAISGALWGVGCSSSSSQTNGNEGVANGVGGSASTTTTVTASGGASQSSTSPSIGGTSGSTGTTSSGGQSTTGDPAIIVVDQFGYRPNSEKIAVVRDPQTGFDASLAFTPGANYALVDVASGATVFSGKASPWNGGTTHAQSGDKAYWFDFSTVTQEGTYYVLDVDKNVRSPEFRIANDVYVNVLRHAVRTFFYQRAGQAKQPPYADAAWADAASHVGSLQDHQARRYDAKSDASTERDVWGGWYDAGDYNKYTSWTANYVVEMLQAYEENPAAFGDDFGLPESSNGIPDILDEARFGLEYLERLQNSNGSVLSIVGESHASPPSSAKGQSLYGTPNTSGTLAAAAAFASGARHFAKFTTGDMQTFATALGERAKLAFAWAEANPSVVFRNNDAAAGTNGLGSGQQEVDDAGRTMYRLKAAVQLFATTGETSYRNIVDLLYAQTTFVKSTFVYPFEVDRQDALLYYADLPGATAAVKNEIRTKYRTSVLNGNDNAPAHSTSRDPYLAYMKDYVWGSNATKSNQGNLFWAMVTHAIEPTEDATMKRDAERYVHYLHGTNPLGLVFLSNMGQAGAEHSVSAFYHTWFAEGSTQWSRVGVSTYGPPPGFLTGGPNPSYSLDGCCPSNCGSAANNAKCDATAVTPPLGQPAMKSYRDFNANWPQNSWSVTENSCGYQIAYIRLLSKFVD